MKRLARVGTLALLLGSLVIPMALSSTVALADQTLISDWGTLRDSMDTVGDYWVGGVGASIAQDTTHYKEGTGGIAVTAVNGVAGYMTRACSFDFSAVSNFTFWVYVPDRTKLNSIAITMASVTNMSKTHYVTIGATSYLLDGWNHVDVCKSQFTPVGGEVWSDPKVRLRFTATPQAGQDVTITFDDFRTDLVAGARVILTFDDASDTQYDKAHPIMEGNGQTGTMFVPVTHIGAGGDMTLGEITELVNGGWDIGGHGWASLDFTTLDEAGLVTEVDNARDYLVNLGFEPFAVSYPFNGYNDAVVTRVATKYYAGRTVNSGLYTAHSLPNGYDEFHLRANAVTNITSAATVQGWIDSTIDRNSVLVLLFHILVDEGAGESSQYLTADFETISDYLKTKENASELEVVTVTEYYAELGLLYPEVPAPEPPQTSNFSVAAVIAFIILAMLMAVPAFILDKVGMTVGGEWINLARLLFVLCALMAILFPYLTRI